jgi:hypothetical protein
MTPKELTVSSACPAKQDPRPNTLLSVLCLPRHFIPRSSAGSFSDGGRLERSPPEADKRVVKVSVFDKDHCAPALQA